MIWPMKKLQKSGFERSLFTLPDPAPLKTIDVYIASSLNIEQTMGA